jgi:endonuclease-8
MPEGDTIHRTAASLRRALGEGPLTMFDAGRTPGPRPDPGERIEEIRARGKHLLVRFAGGSVLHTHLGMSGSWRIEPGGTDAPPGSARQPVVVIGTERSVAVCRKAPTVELLETEGVRRHPVLSALGPDLCDPSPDLDEVLRRLDATDPTTPIGVALLDQRIAAGIGNVYRSEVLWACGVDPFVTLHDLDEGAPRALYATAHRLLRANLTGYPRRTVPGGLAVYDRAGRACRRCGRTIGVRRLGDQARTTWWCPGCQTAGGPPREGGR